MHSAPVGIVEVGTEVAHRRAEALEDQIEEGFVGCFEGGLVAGAI